MAARRAAGAAPAVRASAATQLPLDFSVRPRAASTPSAPFPPDPSPDPSPAVPSRYLTRREAAAYVRCSVRFLDGMGLPYIRKGRCKVYDRIDLDDHMQHDKCRGRAWKETLWPVNVDSTAARIRGTGGSTSFSRTDAAYAKALGVSIAPVPKNSRSV